MPPASILSYANNMSLGRPQPYRPMPMLRDVRPTSGGRRLSGLGQPGANIDLPNGTTHVVQGVNTTGEILTTSGWQSATQPGGVERWINVHTGDVMLEDGAIVKAAVPGMGLSWWWLGAGALALGGLVLMTGGPRRGGGGGQRRRRRRRRR